MDSNPYILQYTLRNVFLYTLSVFPGKFFLEIVFLLFMHHIKVDTEVLSRIFGQEVSRYTFMSMRKAIEKVSNHKLVKNKNGNYHFE